MEDQPGFLVQYAEVIALFMSMAALIISGLWQWRSRLQRSHKNRADMYNNEILRLVYQIRKVVDLEQIDMYREQMFDIFRNVIKDYDVDRISLVDFQSFTLPWEVAIRTPLSQRNSAHGPPAECGSMISYSKTISPSFEQSL